MLQDLTLTAEQYDICWSDLGLGEHVYPLQVRSHGRTHEERAELRRRVYQQLTARGLARGEWLGPELQHVLTLLARAPVWLDMHWLSAPGQAEMDRVVAARSGEQGLLARLDAVGLRLMPCRGTSLLITLVGQLPTTAAARGQSISLPREVLVRAVGGSVYDRPAGTSSRFRLQFLALETVLAKPRVRGGQIVANARDGTGRRRRSRPVEWFDTEAGRWTARVLPTTDGSEHLTVTPADGALLATQLREMLDSILR